MTGRRHPPGWACLLACVAIAAMLAAGCGGSAGSASSDGNGTTEATTAPVRKTGPTRAALASVDGSAATGTARFLVRPQDTPVLQIEAEGLEPTHGASRYVIWIAGDRHDMVSEAAFPVGADGRLSRKIDNGESQSFVEDGTKTELLITKVGKIGSLDQSLSQSSDPWDPPQIGKPVLSGNFEGALVGSSPPHE